MGDFLLYKELSTIEGIRVGLGESAAMAVVNFGLGFLPYNVAGGLSIKSITDDMSRNSRLDEVQRFNFANKVIANDVQGVAYELGGQTNSRGLQWDEQRLWRRIEASGLNRGITENNPPLTPRHIINTAEAHGLGGAVEPPYPGGDKITEWPSVQFPLRAKRLEPSG